MIFAAALAYIVNVFCLQSSAALKTRAPLQTRVGIATGMVVVRDLIGSGPAQEQAGRGNANLAARLEGLGMPGSLVIADANRHQLGQLSDLRDLAPQPNELECKCPSGEFLNQVNQL